MNCPICDEVGGYCGHAGDHNSDQQDRDFNLICPKCGQVIQEFFLENVTHTEAAWFLCKECKTE